MSTARRLSLTTTPLLRLATALAVATLAVAPALARGELEFRHPDQPVHPIVGGITDDGGPFNNVLWGSPQVVGIWVLPEDDKAEETTTGAPSMAFNPVSGHALAVWTADRDVVFSRFAVGGWSEPTTLATGAGDPLLVVDEQNGNVHLVYASDDGGVWHMQAPADLSNWSVARRASKDGEYATRPTAKLHGTLLSIAYESLPQGPRSNPRNIVIAQEQESDFSHTVLATTYYEDATQIRLDSDGANGRLLVRWITAEGLFGWTIQSSQGVWGPVGVEALEPEVPTRQPARDRKR